MADVAVEKIETPITEKAPAEEVDSKKDAPEEASITENGAANAKENGTKETVPESEADTEAPAADVADAENNVEDKAASAEAAVEENGDEETVSKEANGDSPDSAPADTTTVKRKVVEAEAKTGESVATPEKKAKLDEATKEDVQNGSEASEVAA